MIYRPATIADIHQCERLDGSYVTDCVWQMEEAATADSIGVSFRRTRTPRRMDVPYPRGTQDLYEDWQRNECFLVADELGSIYGYLDMTVRHWRWHGWLEHLVVDRSARDRGLATRLLEAAEHWGRGSELESITVPVQPKNDPAIRFVARRGYTFGGFVDRYFINGDIALLFVLRL